MGPLATGSQTWLFLRHIHVRDSNSRKIIWPLSRRSDRIGWSDRIWLSKLTGDDSLFFHPESQYGTVYGKLMKIGIPHFAVWTCMDVSPKLGAPKTMEFLTELASVIELMMMEWCLMIGLVFVKMMMVVLSVGSLILPTIHIWVGLNPSWLCVTS